MRIEKEKPPVGEQAEGQVDHAEPFEHSETPDEQATRDANRAAERHADTDIGEKDLPEN